MARYKPYDYNQLMMVPVSLEEQLIPGTLEYAIHHVIEERIDLSIFEDRYCNDETGRKAIDRKVYRNVSLPAGRTITELEAFKPDFEEEGLYFIHYLVDEL